MAAWKERVIYLNRKPKANLTGHLICPGAVNGIIPVKNTIMEVTQPERLPVEPFFKFSHFLPTHDHVEVVHHFQFHAKAVGRIAENVLYGV